MLAFPHQGEVFLLRSMKGLIFFRHLCVNKHMQGQLYLLKAYPPAEELPVQHSIAPVLAHGLQLLLKHML